MPTVAYLIETGVEGRGGQQGEPVGEGLRGEQGVQPVHHRHVHLAPTLAQLHVHRRPRRQRGAARALKVKVDGSRSARA